MSRGGADCASLHVMVNMGVRVTACEHARLYNYHTHSPLTR